MLSNTEVLGQVLDPLEVMLTGKRRLCCREDRVCARGRGNHQTADPPGVFEDGQGQSTFVDDPLTICPDTTFELSGVFLRDPQPSMDYRPKAHR